jgi:hypothetical protein
LPAAGAAAGEPPAGGPFAGPAALDGPIDVEGCMAGQLRLRVISDMHSLQALTVSVQQLVIAVYCPIWNCMARKSSVLGVVWMFPIAVLIAASIEAIWLKMLVAMLSNDHLSVVGWVSVRTTAICLLLVAG